MLLDQRTYEAVSIPTGTPSPDTMVRIEDKFFVKKTLREELLTLLETQMKPYYPLPGTRFTEVESMYYDSPSLDIYHSHFLSKHSRYKVRTRKYAPNGFWANDRSHLELKSKDAGISRKVRFLMGSNEMKTLAKGLPIRLTKDLGRLNPDAKLRALEKRLSRLNDIIRQNSLIPTCRVTYTRQAFEQGDVRVTVDDQIHSELMAKQTVAYARARRSRLPTPLLEEAREMLNRFSREDYLVVEVKHLSEMPAWLTEFVARAGSEKVSFSKYCYSMTRYLLSN